MILQLPDDADAEHAAQLQCIAGTTVLHATQQQWITNPEAIAKSVGEYWDTFWLRDSPNLDASGEMDLDQPLGDFPSFRDAMRVLDAHLPTWDEVEVNIPDHAWKQALSALPAHAAKGCDGFAKVELALLPDKVWAALAKM